MNLHAVVSLLSSLVSLATAAAVLVRTGAHLERMRQLAELVAEHRAHIARVPHLEAKQEQHGRAAAYLRRELAKHRDWLTDHDHELQRLTGNAPAPRARASSPDPEELL